MITVKGGSKYQKEYAESIANYCIEKMMPRLKDKLDITIRIKRDLVDKENVLGDAMWEDDELAPREFTIRVAGAVKLRTMLTTIAHEMVHVKQYARKEMRQLSRSNKVAWLSKHVDTKKIDYWDLPWEIEAHGREEGLFIRWASECGHGDKEWAQVKY